MAARVTVAALFVEKGGVYYGLPNVDPWDKARDARLYTGPHPVVAHPPCERGGRYWSGGPSAKTRRKKGDDGGCFAAALAAVRRYGGVLEHPEASHAWLAHGLVTPPRGGGWVPADFYNGFSGWTCCVEQGWYGHKARKPTWLYVHGLDELPAMKWGKAPGVFRPMQRPGRRYRAERNIPAHVKGLKTTERAATPTAFRDLLLGIAGAVKSIHVTTDPRWNAPTPSEEKLQVGMADMRRALRYFNRA